MISFCYGCCSKNIPANQSSKDFSFTCQEALQIFESNLLAEVPISRGPEPVIEYLSGLEGFYRNKDWDFGNGSVRFNAKNASLFGKHLVDDRSLFLLNYSLRKDGFDAWSLFQAIYFFDSKEDKDDVVKALYKTLYDDLDIEIIDKYDIERKGYDRIHLPCGSGFNFKHGDFGDRHVIDILWVPDVTQ